MTNDPKEKFVPSRTRYIQDLPPSIIPRLYDYEREREMWIEIRSGLIGLREAMKFASNPSAALGMVHPAMGRIIGAIEKRYDLRESVFGREEQDQSNPTPNE